MMDAACLAAGFHTCRLLLAQSRCRGPPHLQKVSPAICAGVSGQREELHSRCEHRMPNVRVSADVELLQHMKRQGLPADLVG